MNLHEQILELISKYPPKQILTDVWCDKTRTYNKVPATDCVDILWQIRKRLMDFVEFDFNSIGNDGVYLIEDFYLGKTKNVKNRIGYHIIEAYGLYPEKHCIKKPSPNVVKNNLIKTTLENRKLKLTMIDSNLEREKELITQYFNNGYPLTNRHGKPKLKHKPKLKK